ncbi:THxN family PEP-CTERM protein [Congregibacter variabilis]|uniref:THxN family PEP-CTERM protein n=1 Tax=Congregibacter variabilis TaxID=3081200 RepID=A0ABZ0I7E6_9GAMM|nr:THxN family PEP-CTERM protein [Congregibacter sp. IMCC43200]
MKKILHTAAAVGVSCFLASAANASLVTEWEFAVTAGFTGAATFDADTGGTTIETATELSWGKTGGDYTDTTQNSTNSRSALVITNPAVSGSLFTNGGPAVTSTLTHYNNTILRSFESLLGATINTTFALTPKVPAGEPRETIDRDITFSFIETPNKEDCGFVSASECDDIFVLNPADLTDTFIYNDFVYTTRVIPVGLGPLSDGACTVAGAETGCFGLQTLEGQANAFGVLVDITARAVPVPATLALFGLGLIGVAVTRRRKV